MTTYTEIENVGTAERVVRGVVGMGLLEAVLLVPALSPAMIALFSMVALYAVFTAIIGVDPFYAISRVVQRRGEAVKASVTAIPSHSETAATRHYKKAA